jgi:hypothetical protein
MKSICNWARGALLGGLLLSMGGCYHMDSMAGTSVEQITVDARKFNVRVEPTGTPNQYRLLVIRATLVLNPDPDNEAARGEEVAQRIIKRTCKGRPFEELVAGLDADINYRVLFECH